jgi:Flp pilus assembly protein TadG
MRQGIRRFMVEEDGIAGAALVEFTIFAPMLVIMSIYTMDFGLVFYKKLELQNAAQAGAQWAIANRVYNSSSIQIAAQNATKLPAGNFNVTSGQFCGCSKDSGGNPKVTLLSSPGPCTATSTCTNGVPGTYVTVCATFTAAAGLHGNDNLIKYGLVPSSYNTGTNSNGTCGGGTVLTAQSTARIQ